MTTNHKKYFAKILLFGEYTLLKGSKALSIPFERFGGRLECQAENSVVKENSNKRIRDFYKYLKKSKPDFPKGLNFEMDRFESDLDHGLYLNSDIPEGYGMGSSGVLVAAVYEKYAINPANPELNLDLGSLKNNFSFMESYFHGKSSGIDPLTSFIRKPLLISSPEKIETLDFSIEKNLKNSNAFLVDTGIHAQTGGHVRNFLEKTGSSKYEKILESGIMPRNNNCIDLIINEGRGNFLNEVRKLSALQLEYFQEMIPGNFITLWERGIESGDYFFKLCGSGGGGFILGFTEDYKRADEIFREQGIKAQKIFE